MLNLSFKFLTKFFFYTKNKLNSDFFLNLAIESSYLITIIIKALNLIIVIIIICIDSGTLLKIRNLILIPISERDLKNNLNYFNHTQQTRAHKQPKCAAQIRNERLGLYLRLVPNTREHIRLVIDIHRQNAIFNCFYKLFICFGKFFPYISLVLEHVYICIGRELRVGHGALIVHL